MARVIRQVTVVRDGMHNAFTDLAWWQGQYWVSYRKGSEHASLDGEAIVACSTDRVRFREVARVKVPGDCRDPKLVESPDGRLVLFFPSWLQGYQARKLQQYISFSADGFTWTTPQAILDSEKWLWRMRRHDGLWYGLVEGIGPAKGPGALYLELITSRDLLHWDVLTRVGRPEDNLNEADICFQADGEAWIVARGSRRPQDYAYFASARPPYREWTLSDLTAMIHCPCILRHQDEWYVAGRSNPRLEGDATFAYLSPSSLGIWRLRRGEVTPVLRLPASGDCAYPGFIKDGDGRLCLSYYSQHAYELGIVPKPYRLLDQEPHRTAEVSSPDDVYFAELSLP
jgi:hypothetical protein